MIYNFKKALCVVAAVGLGACGGSKTGANGGEPVLLDPVNILVGGERVVFNPDNDELRANGTLISDAPDTRVNGVNAAARVTTDRFGNFLTARANRGEVFAFYYAEDTGTGRRHGGIYGRSIDYELQPSGSAELSGQYAGMLISNLGVFQQQDVQRIMLGDMDLDINLANRRITGAITNRRAEAIGNASRFDTLSDVLVGNAMISNLGTFEASATAEPSVVRTTNTSNVFITTAAATGTLEGVVGGRTGQDPDVTGLLSLTHRSSGGATFFEERGAFYAE